MKIWWEETNRSNRGEQAKQKLSDSTIKVKNTDTQSVQENKVPQEI